MKTQITVGDVMLKYLPIIVLVGGLIASAVTVQLRSIEALRLAQEAHEWQDDWEKNGQLPDDIKQNAAITRLQKDVDAINGLNLDARLTAMEVTLIQIKEAVIK